MHCPTPHKVSEEDLNKSATSSEKFSVNGLRRLATASCLVNLMESTTLDSEGGQVPEECLKAELTVSPFSELDAFVSQSTHEYPLSPCSPWGHFVDLVDQDDTCGLTSLPGDLISKKVGTGFPAPLRAFETFDPYPATMTTVAKR